MTDEILEDFALPDYPAREMESRSSSRAIDRYVASVLSESEDDSIYSTARKSASTFNGDFNFDDDSSFEPVNPFDDNSPDCSYSISNNRWKRKAQKHWKPLSILAFGVAVVLLVVAGVASNKNVRSRSNQDDGNMAVGMSTELASTNAPFSPVETESPTYLPTYMPTNGNSTDDAITTEPPLRVTNAPVPESTSSTPTKNPTLESITPTSNPTTAIPTAKPTTGPTMPEKYYEMLKAAKFISGKVPFERTDTAQSLAFHWLYFSGNPSSNLYEFFEQYATAVVFFSLTKMHQSSILPQDTGTDFTTRREICGWNGVRCAYNYTSEMVHVTEIKLPTKKLTGTIPSEIGFLPYLVTFDLANNEITGTIPEELYGLERLKHLYLNDNKLQGTISPRIDELNLAVGKFSTSS